VLLIGLGIIAGGIVEYIELGASERAGHLRRVWIEIVLYRPSGAPGSWCYFSSLEARSPSPVAAGCGASSTGGDVF
jgi:hypothetical protein